MENTKKLNYDRRTGERELRWTHFPYSIKLVSVKPLLWTVVGRSSKPIGLHTFDMLEYEGFQLRGLARELDRIDVRSADERENLVWPYDVYLYNDACVPTRKAEYMQAYLKRLGRLMRLNARH